MTTTMRPTIAATTTIDEITIKAIVQAGIPSSRTSTSALLYVKLIVIIIKGHQQGIMEEKWKHKECTSRNVKKSQVKALRLR